MRETAREPEVLNVLYLEDSPSDVELTYRALTKAGYDVRLRRASTESDYETALYESPYDLVLLDYTLPGYDATAALKRALAVQSGVPVICISGTVGEDTAVELLKQGATDYVLKDRMARLEIAVRRARESAEAHKAHMKVQRDLQRSRDLLDTVVASTPDAVYVKDLEGRYLLINESAARFVGREAGDVIGVDDREIFSASEADTIMNGDREVLTRAAPLTYEELLTVASGDQRTFLSTKGPLFDGSGRPYGLFGFARDITDRKRAEEGLRLTAEQLHRTVEATVLAMGRICEIRDPYTAGHERRVAELATEVAAELGWDAGDITGLRLAALIHDVGKVGVPAEILSKPTGLSSVEFALIQQHAQAGYDILAPIEFRWPVAQMVLQHHERADGSGYPQGLSAEMILPGARVLAIADVVEAMSSHRPYRPGLGLDLALDEIRRHAGVKYDADAVSACLRVVESGFAFSS